MAQGRALHSQRRRHGFVALLLSGSVLTLARLAHQKALRLPTSGIAFASHLSQLRGPPGLVDGWQNAHAFRVSRKLRSSRRSSASQGQGSLTDSNGPQEWFEQRGSQVTFGASAPIDVSLPGKAEVAQRWLVGCEGYDSVDRLIRAARPVGADVRYVATAQDGARSYELALPGIELFGLGKIKSGVRMYGATCTSGGPQVGGGPFLKIGSDGGPFATLLAGGQELPFPSFDLTITGALGIEPDGTEKGRIRGWISVEIKGEMPRIGFFEAPEAITRGAAKEVCSQTVGFATRRLTRDLRDDFVLWQREQR